MTIPEHTHTLDVYDMAVLAGGLPRLVDTALVALVESGHVRVERSGAFRADTASSRHPVEAAVLAAVGTRGHRMVETIRWQVLRDQRLDQEFRHLSSDGLVRRALPSRLVGKTHAHTTAAGRRALRQFAEHPPADGGSAVLVALHGRDALPDDRLRAEIFERPPVVLPPRRSRRPSHALDPGSLGRPGTPAAGGYASFVGGHGFAGDGTVRPVGERADGRGGG